jgi:hypothetical protein
VTDLAAVIAPTGGDFPTLALFAGASHDLVGDGDTLTGSIQGVWSGDDADAVDFSSADWTTSETNYLRIEADSSNAAGGAWDTGKWRLVTAAGVQLKTSIYLEIFGLQIHGGSGNDVVDPFPGGDVRIDACYLRTAGGSGLILWQLLGAAKVRNTIFESLDGTGVGVQLVSATCVAHNNTFVDLTTVFDGDVEARNNGCHSCGALASGTLTVDVTNSTSSPTFDGSTWLLDSGDSTWLGQGTDLSANAWPVTSSIEGTTRPGTPAIGASEPAASGGTPLVLGPGAPSQADAGSIATNLGAALSPATTRRGAGPLVIGIGFEVGSGAPSIAAAGPGVVGVSPAPTGPDAGALVGALGVLGLGAALAGAPAQTVSGPIEVALTPSLAGAPGAGDAGPVVVTLSLDVGPGAPSGVAVGPLLFGVEAFGVGPGPRSRAAVGQTVLALAPAPQGPGSTAAAGPAVTGFAFDLGPGPASTSEVGPVLFGVQTFGVGPGAPSRAVAGTLASLGLGGSMPSAQAAAVAGVIEAAVGAITAAARSGAAVTPGQQIVGAALQGPNSKATPGPVTTALLTYVGPGPSSTAVAGPAQIWNLLVFSAGPGAPSKAKAGPSAGVTTAAGTLRFKITLGAHLSVRVRAGSH